jgi:hypothetical protein
MVILWWELVTLHEVCVSYVVCAHFDHVEVLCSWEGRFVGKCLILIMAMSHAYMLLCILLALLVLNMWLYCLFYVSFIACCSALCLCEKHILAFVDLIHALPTRGRKKYPIHQGGEINVCRGQFPTFCTHLFRGACIHAWGAICCLIYALCFALLPMVSSPFACPWGVFNFGAFCLGCVELLPLP